MVQLVDQENAVVQVEEVQSVTTVKPAQLVHEVFQVEASEVKTVVLAQKVHKVFQVNEVLVAEEVQPDREELDYQVTTVPKGTPVKQVMLVQQVQMVTEVKLVFTAFAVNQVNAVLSVV